MDRLQEEKSKQFPDLEEAQYEQQEQETPAVVPADGNFPAEERDADEEAHRQLEERG